MGRIREAINALTRKRLPRTLLLNGADREYHPGTGEVVFGPRVDENEQWLFGANRLAEMACKTADELEYEIVEDGFTIRNTKYDKSMTKPQLWQALWCLERDVRDDVSQSWRRVEYIGEPEE